MKSATPASSTDSVPSGQLKRLAQVRFMRWQQKKSRPEWDRLLSELPKRDLSTLGRAARRQKIHEDLLASEAVREIAIYGTIAKKHQCAEMYSDHELNLFRDRIMTRVHTATVGLEELNARDFDRAGGASPSSIAAVQHRLCLELPSKVLGVVNSELDVLRAEGDTLQQRRSSALHAGLEAEGEATSTDKATAGSSVYRKGRSAGRRADVESNHNIARILERFGSGWRDRLNDVPDALDEEGIPLPGSKKRKRNACSNWADMYFEDREGLVKALQYRLDWTRQHPSI